MNRVEAPEPLAVEPAMYPIQQKVTEQEGGEELSPTWQPREWTEALVLTRFQRFP